MVCEVAFTEWTGEERLRHPVYLGMRDDKEANQVVKE
jgi:bifunctional non-homologous end joining protein LigD